MEETTQENLDEIFKLSGENSRYGTVLITNGRDSSKKLMGNKQWRIPLRNEYDTNWTDHQIGRFSNPAHLGEMGFGWGPSTDCRKEKWRLQKSVIL